jgi:hypothetical protein
VGTVATLTPGYAHTFRVADYAAAPLKLDRRHARPGSEADAQSAQKLGQPQLPIAMLPQECMSRLAIFAPT